MSDYTLPREERLRSMTAIRRLFSEGQSGFVYPVRYVFMVTPRSDERKVGADGVDGQAVGGAELAAGRSVEAMFSVPKKFHKRANRRNLFKRRMRESYRLGRGEISRELAAGGKHLQIAFIYSTKECHTYKTINYALQRILEQVRRTL